jgi:diguanylate cyclase (GGDEF)-like protein/PAS domain S-box-containing protein
MTEPRDKTAKRKRTEEALRESEERYRDLLENANDLIQSVTPEGSLIYVNRAWRETLGYSEDEIPGLSLMDVIHPDSKAHCAETFQRVMAGEDIERVEAMFVAKDGRTITVEGNINCRFKDGKPVATRGIFRDITQRKQAEEALRIKDRAIASSTNAIAIADLEGNLTYVNASFLSLWGYVEQEVLGKPAIGFWEMQERAAEVVQELRWEGSWIGELVAKKKDGSPFYVQLSASMVTNEAGEPVCMMGSFVDITERRQALQALRKRTHDLGERVKELNCLYGISNLVQRPDISLEEMLQGTVDLIPPGWQYPEVTCARITLEGQEFRTENFRETAWRQTSDIIVNGERSGAVEVCYLEERRESDEGSFLLEKGDLINAIAERLGRVSERRRAEEALRESEARYKALFAGAPEGMLVADLQTKQFRHANPAMCRMFGYTEEEFLRIGVTDIHPKESLSYVLAEFEAQVRGEKLLAADIPCRRKDSSLFYANVNGIIVVLDGRRCNVGFFTDVTERKKAEEALRESEERYRSIFESIQDVFYRTDAEGIITEISPSIERFGYTREALIGTQVLGVYEDPEERSGLLKALLEQGGVADHEIRLKTGDGRLLSVSVSAHILRGPDGTFSGVEGTLRDISERKRAEQALRESKDALHEQARRDPLTGVLNHGAIVDEMRGLISTSEHATRGAVAMIDVNRLKVTNDTYGHQVGDAVLVAVATALSRDDALVGRYGGDEFVAILPGADRNAAERYRSEGMDALAHATITDPQTGATVRAGASIGLAIYPEDGSTLADLLKVSDSAMYAAKRQRPVRRPSPRKHAPDRKAA